MSYVGSMFKFMLIRNVSVHFLFDFIYLLVESA